jgi:hypothetical protein
MIKQAIKFGMFIALIYGLYKLGSIWPTESVIVVGSLACALVVYWLIDLRDGSGSV